MIKAVQLIGIAFNHVGAVGKELSVKASSFPCSLFTWSYLSKAYGFFQIFCERFKERGRGAGGRYVL